MFCKDNAMQYSTKICSPQNARFPAF